MCGRVVQEVICSCKKCVVVDKPPCIYRIYDEYLPGKVRVLVVSESPPPGFKSDYIYNVSRRDRLRQVLAVVFGVPQDRVTDLLVENGVFWSTAVKCRPVSKGYIESMRRNCVDILDLEIKHLTPKKILALGVVAWKSIEELNVEGIPIVKHYHPLYLARFDRGRLPVLKRLILG